MTDYELRDFICEHCKSVFRAHPYENCWCSKCGSPHMLCPACTAVHKLSASSQDRYLNKLEANLQ